LPLAFQTKPLVEVNHATGEIQLHHRRRRKRQTLFRLDSEGLYVWDKLDRCERQIPWEQVRALLEHVL
jgi:hypothetical protein